MSRRLQAIRRPLLALKVIQAERRARAAQLRAKDAEVVAHQRILARTVVAEIARASGRVPRPTTPWHFVASFGAWTLAMVVAVCVLATLLPQ